MAITVQNILNLPSFKDAKVVAGHNGLDNVVTQVSISDSPLTEVDYELSTPGDFYLSEFYFAKDSVEDMITYLTPILDAHSSGICVLDEYIKELPQGIIDYCNKNNFPMILNSVNVPYATMIREIMEQIIADGQNSLLAQGLSSIIERTVDQKTQLKIVKQINPHFHNSITTFFVSLKEGGNTAQEIRDFFDRDIFSSGVLYKKGVIGIISHQDPEKAEAQIAYYLEKLQQYKAIQSIGVSDPAIKLQDISKALNQSIIAADLSYHENNTVLHYCDLGVMKLFVLLSGSPELEEFYHDIIGTLQDYDKEHHAQLYETMLAYHRCNYQYKEAAKELFTHENTIRYRISKVQELITEKAPRDDFRESFSLALKCKAVFERYK